MFLFGTLITFWEFAAINWRSWLTFAGFGVPNSNTTILSCRVIPGLRTALSYSAAVR